MSALTQADPHINSPLCLVNMPYNQCLLCKVRTNVGKIMHLANFAVSCTIQQFTHHPVHPRCTWSKVAPCVVDHILAMLFEGLASEDLHAESLNKDVYSHLEAKAYMIYKAISR